MKDKRCVIPSPKKIDPYYDRMIDLYKKKIEALQAEIVRLKPFEAAVKKRHNGYNPEVCTELNISPPESPEQALQDLQDEWDKIEDDYVNSIVSLQAENKQLKQDLIEFGRHSRGCIGIYGYPCKCGWNNVKKVL